MTQGDHVLSIKALADQLDADTHSRLDREDLVLCLSFAAADDLLELATGTDSLASKPGKNNWIEKTSDFGLPKYIAQIAKALIRDHAMDKSRAIATAISRVKAWAAGGGKVNADTRAKAQKAVADWESLKARNAARSAAKKVSK